MATVLVAIIGEWVHLNNCGILGAMRLIGINIITFEFYWQQLSSPERSAVSTLLTTTSIDTVQHILRDIDWRTLFRLHEHFC